MKRLDTIGIIIKKEKLASFESTKPVTELVLEDLSPFPGYYDQFSAPVDEKELLPRHLFFVLKGFDYFNDDAFIRNTHKIKANTGFAFDAVTGQLTLFNEIYPCLRIHTYDLEIIPALVEAYKMQGIQFLKQRPVKPYESIIKIRTLFQLDEMEEGIYRHIRKPAVHFITIPFMPDWDTFESMTLSIKRNSDYKHFDAALAAAYTKPGMVELVRIYDKSCTLDNLRDLKAKYFRELNREMQK